MNQKRTWLNKQGLPEQTSPYEIDWWEWACSFVAEVEGCCSECNCSECRCEEESDAETYKA